MTTPVAEHPAAPAVLDAQTLDMIRTLLEAEWLTDRAPHTSAEILRRLPTTDRFRSGMPPLYELCWHRAGIGDPLTYCDRKAFHGGLHSFECEPPF